MRPVALGSPPDEQEAFKAWAKEAFAEIERASYEGIELVADAYAVTGTITEQREFNVDTADLADIRNIIATFLTDLKKRGPKITAG